MARLDRLGAAKEVAQLGATLGREFNYEFLRALSPLDDSALQQELQQLVKAELLYQRGLPPQAAYLFKHALIQDAAYQSLLKNTRRHYHQQIAQMLQKRFPDVQETQPELVAHHYTEAGLIVQAIPYWLQAGQRATQHSAHAEAISHLTRGLELLKTLPDTSERAQQELSLQLALGVPLMATKGYADPGVEHAYSRARVLCQQGRDTPHLFPALLGLCGFYLVRAELTTARELGEQCLSLARREHRPDRFLGSHHMLGLISFYCGDFVPAQAHFEQVRSLYEPQRHRPNAFRFGQDPGMASLSHATLALWALGYPDQALKKSSEAVTLTRELSHPFNLAGTLIWAVCWLHFLRRDVQAVREQAEAVIALSAEQGFAVWGAIANIFHGWALVEQGQAEEGIQQIQQGLAASRATGSRLFKPTGLALLTEAYRKVGQVDKGRTVLAEALQVVHETGEREYEAELYRLKGELTLQKNRERATGSGQQGIVTDPQFLPPDSQGEAETCFLKAIEIARRQQAKSLELRATTSLARLWRQQGKHHEARNMLFEIYTWFTEGFAAKDLQEAKMLLDSLESRV